MKFLIQAYDTFDIGRKKETDGNICENFSATFRKRHHFALLPVSFYKDQYAINTVNEYWAEGTQWWFWSNIEFYDGETRVQSPDDLKAYDSTLYHIFERVYAGHHIPADVYYGLNLAPIR